MTIHHDKLAYGKLAPESEGLSEERIAQTLLPQTPQAGRIFAQLLAP